MAASASLCQISLQKIMQPIWLPDAAAELVDDLVETAHGDAQALAGGGTLLELAASSSNSDRRRPCRYSETSRPCSSPSFAERVPVLPRK
jgi:hypothetical protein